MGATLLSIGRIQKQLRYNVTCQIGDVATRATRQPGDLDINTVQVIGNA